MQIITLRCPDCGTIVAENVLEKQRVMKCPRMDCESVLRFDDLPEDDRNYVLDNKEKYKSE
ncbi:hypothetical protein [Haloplanus pelagicus]|uniref:hypothetical protein n=1 Tax=Haloplanus pelagicus TaxID=2949995 RepID=UPI00203A92EC|nr:hypothetical protein [Haloplanus sp. HW8-1]